MGYTRQQTINELKKATQAIDKLYNSACVNWSGETTDTKEFYSEVIANELVIYHLPDFNKISPITRQKTYCRENHKNIEIDLESNRSEEIFAKRIAYLEFEHLGIIKDYQVPLKDTQADKGVGKIDLISYNEDTKTLYLIELKYKGNKETLLRATLETYTYFKTVDQIKLINDCFNSHQFILSQVYNNVNPDEIKVVPAVLVTPDCNPYTELGQMEMGERPKLKALALALDIEYFRLELYSDAVTL